MEGIAVGLLAFFVIFYLLIFIGGIVNYILMGISLYTIADRRKISTAWGAWVPVVNYWCIGSIVDYHANLNGKKSYWRKVLLTLILIGVIGFIGSYVFLLVEIIGIATMGNMVPTLGYMEEEQAVSTILGTILPPYIVMILSIVAINVSNICLYVCYFKIFEYLAEDKAIKYFLISLLVPFGLAGCLMKCRKSCVGVSEIPMQLNYAVIQPQTNETVYTPEEFDNQQDDNL
ncbi:MAG: hypothetical protein E7568_04410 [Ruminococcaceae bacterium]|nr:hypothetical protein [Oscillospiraceae bacterium]